MKEESFDPVVSAITALAYIASLLHVFVQSWKDKRVGHPFRHTIMVAIVAWPLGYLFWVLWWPGSVRQRIFGSDADRIKNEIDSRFDFKGR